MHSHLSWRAKLAQVRLLINHTKYKAAIWKRIQKCPRELNCRQLPLGLKLLVERNCKLKLNLFVCFFPSSPLALSSLFWFGNQAHPGELTKQQILQSFPVPSLRLAALSHPLAVRRLALLGALYNFFISPQMTCRPQPCAYVYFLKCFLSPSFPLSLLCSKGPSAPLWSISTRRVFDLLQLDLKKLQTCWFPQSFIQFHVSWQAGGFGCVALSRDAKPHNWLLIAVLYPKTEGMVAGC